MIRLAKDVAVTLGKPDAPLIQALRGTTIRPYIFEGGEDTEVDMRCEFICQPPNTPLFCSPCGRPVLWSGGERRCAEHLYSKRVVHTLPVVHPIEHEGGTLFVGDDDTVYNVEYVPIGIYERKKKLLTLFTVL